MTLCSNCAERIPHEAQSFELVVRRNGPRERYRLCSLDCLGHWMRSRRGNRSEG